MFGPGDGNVYFSAAGEKGEYSIWSAPVRGGAPRRVHTAAPETPTGLSVSPDGSRLLFARMRNESHLRTLTRQGARPAYRQQVLRAYIPSYSPDGKWLAFAVEAQGRNRNFLIMPADGGEAVPVSDDPGQKEGGTVWTREGELLYNYVTGAEVEFRAFDPRTRKTRTIHKRGTEGLFHPVLMPNGTDLLSSCSKPFNVCVGPVAAAKQKQITFERDGAIFAISSAAGDWIAYETRRRDHDQIAVVRPDGSEGKLLTDDAASNWAYSFSSDSRRIAFASFRHGVWTLWWIDRITGERKQLTEAAGFGPFVRTPAWRPGSEEFTYESFEVHGNIFALELR